MTNELLDRTEQLTDEKYNFLESQQRKSKEINEHFDIDRTSDLWYTIKIAELQLILEELKKNKPL